MRSAWDWLRESLGDDDDELDGFAGQLVPRPTTPHAIDMRADRYPPGREVHRPIVLPDGTTGIAWWERPGGLYDVTVHSHAVPYRRVLHSSEFRFLPSEGGTERKSA